MREKWVKKKKDENAWKGVREKGLKNYFKINQKIYEK